MILGNHVTWAWHRAGSERHFFPTRPPWKMLRVTRALRAVDLVAAAQRLGPAARGELAALRKTVGAGDGHRERDVEEERARKNEESRES